MDPDLERTLLHDGNRIDLSVETLGFFVDEDETPTPDERSRGLRQANLLGGLLWHAATTFTDHLFDDVLELHDLTDDDPAAVRSMIQTSFVLHRLPKRYWHRFTPLFGRHLVIASADLTARLTQGWREPACVAQELLLRCLLDEMEVLVDTYELAPEDLPEDWRSVLEENLLEDDDVELLYRADADGVENDGEFLSSVGSVPLAFEDWFVPFNDERLPPYSEKEPAGAQLI